MSLRTREVSAAHAAAGAQRRGRGLAGGIAAAVLLCAAVNAAQAQAGRNVGFELGLDPISITGPDPSKRFQDVKIEQRLDAQAPLDARFRDEEGNEVTLAQYFEAGKPVVLGLVYYNCPTMCGLMINGMLAAFDGAGNRLEIGEDYIAINISIAPEETPELAAAKKDTFLARMSREGAREGWHWLTGEAEHIDAVADAVGYGYAYDPLTGLYAHASGIMVLTPEGRVSSYYLGIEYLPRTLQFGIMDAAEGRIGSLVDNLILLCYAYDPSKGAYGFLIFNALRLGGGLTVAGILAFWLVHFLKKRKRIDGEAHVPDGGHLSQN